MLKKCPHVMALMACVAAGAAQAPAPVPRTCPPVDQAADDPDLFLFRAQLQLAVARRDVPAVLAMTSPEVRISFGPDDGFEAFERKLRAPGDQVWTELARVLALGGSFDTPGTFVAPYTRACIRDLEDVVVVGSDVPVRSGASTGARPIASVGYAVLKGRIGSSKDGWAAVVLPDGRPGYVEAGLTRTAMDYRAFISRSGPSWRLTVFIAGD